MRQYLHTGLVNNTTTTIAMDSEENLLQSFEVATGHATSFLTPPISTCQNPLCQLHRAEGSLHAHHNPSPVTLYFLDGPKAAMKIALRCRSCDTIYNYSKYGRKTSIGERFYGEKREFVEVSDTVFCSRRMHEMFCNLKLYQGINFSNPYPHTQYTQLGVIFRVCRSIF